MRIKSTIRNLLRNPMSEWVLWAIKKLLLEFKNPTLAIGYLSTVNRCRFGKYNTVLEYTSLSNVEMGDFSYIASNSTLKNVVMGKYCSIAPNVKCGFGMHPAHTYVSTHPVFFSALPQTKITFAEKNHFQELAPIKIGNDVWIGIDAVIFDGVNIGDGAIIGAGAVVTKDVPAYAVVVGVPAKILRYRFEPDEVAFLLRFKWWDKDFDWIKDNYLIFHDIKSFCKKVH